MHQYNQSLTVHKRLNIKQFHINIEPWYVLVQYCSAGFIATNVECLMKMNAATLVQSSLQMLKAAENKLYGMHSQTQHHNNCHAQGTLSTRYCTIINEATTMKLG